MAAGQTHYREKTSVRMASLYGRSLAAKRRARDERLNRRLVGLAYASRLVLSFDKDYE
jgi:hypothetical protein